MVKGFGNGVISHGTQRGHIDHASHFDPTALDDTAPSMLTAVAVVSNQKTSGLEELLPNG